MSASSASPSGPGHQAAQPGAKQLKPLSCTSCRQRKVKCNKLDPCINCQKSGIQCVFPKRTRVPREKQPRSKTRDQELMERISRLESLVSRVGAAKEARKEPLLMEEPTSITYSEPPKMESSLAPMIKSTSENGNPDRLDAQYISFIKRQESGGIHVYHSGDFWSNLSEEVDGLRQLLDDDSDEENDELTPSSSDQK